MKLRALSTCRRRRAGSQHQVVSVGVVAHDHRVVPARQHRNAVVVENEHRPAGVELRENRVEIARERIGRADRTCAAPRASPLAGCRGAPADRPAARDPRARRSHPTRPTPWQVQPARTDSPAADGKEWRRDPRPAARCLRGSAQRTARASRQPAGATGEAARRARRVRERTQRGTFLKMSMTPTSSRISSTTNTAPISARMSPPAGALSISVAS